MKIDVFHESYTALLYTLPIKDAEVLSFGRFRLRIDRLWGVVLDERMSGYWECETLDTIGL